MRHPFLYFKTSPEVIRLKRVVTNVRLWLLADMLTLLNHVRSTPESGHKSDFEECLLLTQSGHPTAHGYRDYVLIGKEANKVGESGESHPVANGVSRSNDVLFRLRSPASHRTVHECI